MLYPYTALPVMPIHVYRLIPGMTFYLDENNIIVPSCAVTLTFSSRIF